ncbi:acid phosphatase [Nitrospirillum pindoramense]|uniref:acid phosphatase n=1 Tax=Nitrospirillum amazonense TaxID=28077 RepID=UPI001646E257|nr:phosphatase PAP2 family protein [Nitrospirillum amazonense]
MIFSLFVLSLLIPLFFASQAFAFTQCPQPKSYLSPAETPQGLEILPPFPAIGSQADADDVALFKMDQVGEKLPDGTDNPAWLKATADDAAYCAAELLPTFSEAVFGAAGKRLDTTTAPRLVAMLNRVEIDIGNAYGAAKAHFARHRPYERLGNHVCDYESVKGTSSYPSGHAAQGWATGLILAELAPEKAEAILQRAADFGNNRVLCGVHYPSDVAAGRLVATAVVSRLHSDKKGFAQDLACVRAEFHALVDPSAAKPSCEIIKP